MLNERKIISQHFVGKWNSATVYTDADINTKKQIAEMINKRAFAGLDDIKIMPDCHAGNNCLIGFTMPLKDRVDPRVLGSDIGCGVTALSFREKGANPIFIKHYELLARIAVGFETSYLPKNTMDKFFPLSEDYLNLYKKVGISIDKVKSHFGSLGGGNHFIELSQDREHGFYSWIIHSGSRGLGGAVYKYHLNKMKAKKKIPESAINYIKNHCPKEEWANQINDWHNNRREMLTQEDFREYVNDVKIVSNWAYLSRVAMLHAISKQTKVKFLKEAIVNSSHNTIEDNYIRKGAISAKKNEIIIIPMNIQYGTLICVGEGNKAWNYSAPHGAGRVLSRSQAKAIITQEEANHSIGDIFSTYIPIDECPLVYKNPEQVIDEMKPTARVIKYLKPILNVKGD